MPCCMIEALPLPAFPPLPLARPPPLPRLRCLVWRGSVVAGAGKSGLCTIMAGGGGGKGKEGETRMQRGGVHTRRARHAMAG